MTFIHISNSSIEGCMTVILKNLKMVSERFQLGYRIRYILYRLGIDIKNCIGLSNTQATFGDR